MPNSMSASGTTAVLALFGTNPALTFETATAWTAGLDVTAIPSVSLHLSYFNIDYRNKISSPDLNSIFSLESQYVNTGVITLNPSAAQVNAICSQPTFSGSCTGPFGAIIDDRLRNLAIVDTRGLDLSADYSLATQRPATNWLAIHRWRNCSSDSRIHPWKWLL